MGPNVAPLVLGFAAVGLLMLLVGGIVFFRRLLGRIRLRSRSTSSPRYDGWLADQEWMSRPQGARGERAEQTEAPKTQVGEHERIAGRKDSPALEGAQHRVEELLAEAAEQGASVLRESEAEAERRAKEMLADAERRCEILLREREAEAEGKAAEITQGAWKQARKLLEKAEHDAKEIAATAERERARLVDALARERALVEETRTRLSAFLVDVLDEVEGVPPASQPPTNVRDLGEAREIRTSAGGDS